MNLNDFHISIAIKKKIILVHKLVNVINLNQMAQIVYALSAPCARSVSALFLFYLNLSFFLSFRSSFSSIQIELLSIFYRDVCSYYGIRTEIVETKSNRVMSSLPHSNHISLDKTLYF